jgi:hypothetical protein
MPKHQIDVEPNAELAVGDAEVVKRFFGVRNLEEVQRLGGRITVMLSLGPTRKPAKKELEASYVEYLKKFTGPVGEIREKLSHLTTKELKIISKYLEIPTRSSARADEIISSIISSVTAGRKFGSIAGTPPSGGSSDDV